MTTSNRFEQFGLEGMEGGVLGVFVIATKNYREYARSLICSADRHVSEDTSLLFILLTDDRQFGNSLASECEFARVSVMEIHSWGWPEATLLRYRLMNEVLPAVEADVFVYVDADMQFVAPFGIKDLSRPLIESDSQMALVKHPGYFRRNRFYHALLRTPLGPWENRVQSAAFVSRTERQDYVCGGMYWGFPSAFRRMICELAEAVDSDTAKGIRAKHNDESHLNRWLVLNRELCSLQPPRWVFDRTYRQLRDLSPVVVALRKPKRFLRIPS